MMTAAVKLPQNSPFMPSPRSPVLAVTVFMISQRAGSLSASDLILVLDDGELVGKGRHEQLLSSCEVYKEIYESQCSGGEEE